MATVAKNNRFLGWVGRHKVLSGFLILVLGFALFVGVYAIIWQRNWDAQGRREQAKFQSMQALFEDVNQGLKDESLTVDSLDAKCEHTSFGGIFEDDRISCEVEIKVPVDGNAIGSAEIQPLINHALQKYGIDVRKFHNTLPSEDQEYDFPYREGFDCFEGFDLREDPNVQPLLSIGCDGAARQDYYPKDE